MLRIAQIYKADLLNGEGLRNCYFFSGCDFRCPGCFNSELWEQDAPQTRTWTEDDFQMLLRDAEVPYISGITILGGDGFAKVNRKDILELCKRFREHFGGSKSIWIYSGYTWEHIKKAKDERWECLKYIDVLCDGPYIENLRSPEKPWVGSENQRVINVQESLREGRVVLYESN